jgi:alpha-L-fucosidase
VVYAIVLGWPEQAVVLSSLGAAANRAGKVAHMELLGSPERIRFKQSSQGLRIEQPRQKPASDYAVVFKLSLA